MTLREIANLAPEDRRKVANDLCVEISFMRRTLANLRKHVSEHGPVEWWENGKQSMWRESPALKSYTSLVPKYLIACKQLVAMIPKDERPEQDELDAFLAGDY